MTIAAGLADLVSYSREKDLSTVTGDWFGELLSTDPWFRDIVPDVRDSTSPLPYVQDDMSMPTDTHPNEKFKIIPRDQLPAYPPGITSGTSWTSVCINPPIYLPYLAFHCLKNGASIKRKVLTHISQASSFHHSGKNADLIVNCTGLGAAKLGGVMDGSVIPVRGQIVLVRNEPGVMVTISGTDDGEEDVTYVMQRAAGISSFS